MGIWSSRVAKCISYAEWRGIFGDFLTDTDKCLSSLKSNSSVVSGSAGQQHRLSVAITPALAEVTPSSRSAAGGKFMLIEFQRGVSWAVESRTKCNANAPELV